jgi:hypothetical protein
MIRVPVLFACLIVAGCTGIGYQPPRGDQSDPIHGDDGGGIVMRRPTNRAGCPDALRPANGIE